MNNWEMIWKDATHEITMHQLLERTRKCDGIAMDVCGECLSFQEFHRRSDLLGAWLQAKGYGAEDIIILSMKASADLFCMMAGVIKAGAIVTVTEDVLPKERLDKLYEQTNAALRITDGDVETIYREAAGLTLTDITDQVSPGDVYAIWYTSGTTGEPCGIQTMSYNTVCNIIPEPGNEILSDCLKESSALLNISHPSFGLGFTNFFYAIFYGKKFVHIQAGTDSSIRDIAQKINENPGCFLLFTPSAVAACMQDEKARESLRNCSAVMMGADVVKQTLIAEIQKAMGAQGKVINLYGISDVGLVAAKISGDNDKLHAVGKPTAHTEFSVVDEDRNPLPQGEAGEFVISGVRVGPGYLKAPPEKQNRFVEDAQGIRRFYTGDYGYVGSDGEVYLLGRTDRLIKHLGYRVDSIEVEETIRKELHVKNVAVKQFETGKNHILCAFYENERPIDEDQFRKKLGEKLPRYCLPERYIHMEKLPLTQRGKLDYRALTLESAASNGAVYEAPRTDVERAICSAYEKCLRARRVGINDSFFELGGDSVLGMLLLSVLKEEHGLRYRIEDLFNNPRPADLALVSSGSEGIGAFAGEDADLPALPKEMSALLEKDEIEAIYPADAASGLYQFLLEAGTAYTKGLFFRWRIRLDRFLTEQEFRERISLLTKRHPVLRSFFRRDGEGKLWQIFQREGKTPVYYRDLRSMGEEARKRFLSGFFQVMDEGDGRMEAPFQAACFPVKDGECSILIRSRHTHMDGMSAMILMRELTQSQVPEGTDAFYAYRKRRLGARQSFPKELADYYVDFKGNMRLPVPSGIPSGQVVSRKIELTEEQTQKLKEWCGKKGISIPSYVEYCFGKGLLRAMGRREIWISHLYSGRDEGFEHCNEIIGNLFYTMPVRIGEDMSPEAFQKEMLIPWRYPFVTDTAEYRRLNNHSTEGGVVSRIFTPFGNESASLSDDAEEMDTGHYLELRNGRLIVVLRYPADSVKESDYDRIEEVMRRKLEEI